MQGLVESRYLYGADIDELASRLTEVIRFAITVTITLSMRGKLERYMASLVTGCLPYFRYRSLQ